MMSVAPGRRSLQATARAAVLATIGTAVIGLPTVPPAWAAPKPVKPVVQHVSATIDGAMATPPQHFSLVGVVLSDGVAAADLELRTHSARGWSAWRQLSANEESPDSGTVDSRSVWRTTEALWVGDSDAVQVRTGQGHRVPATHVDVAMIDPGRSSADGSSGLPASSAAAATAAPAFFSRAQWGADESMRCTSVSYSRTIKAAVVHHTVNSNNYSTVAEAMRMIRADYAYHVQVNGWCDLGYNFVVDKFGNLYEGRWGGVERPVIGAHAGGFNTDTVGIALLGDFSSVSPPAAMVNTLADIVAWKLSLYGRDPEGTATLTSAGTSYARWPAGTTVTVPTVMGHRDVDTTECPGLAYGALAEVRALAARGSDNAALVQALAADMLGRGLSWNELDGWTRAVTASGSRWTGAQGFGASEEYSRRYVTAAYVSILGRSPDAAGLNGWVADLQQGRVTLDQIPRLLLQSQEFYLRSGRTDLAFADGIYRYALKRPATSDEQRLWAGTTARSGRGETVRGIYDSTESAWHRVAQAYATWLARSANSREQDYWAAAAVQQGDDFLRSSLVVSPEYLARAHARF